MLNTIINKNLKLLFIYGFSNFSLYFLVIIPSDIMSKNLLIQREKYWFDLLLSLINSKV
jgi:hypothetical protein